MAHWVVIPINILDIVLLYISFNFFQIASIFGPDLFSIISINGNGFGKYWKYFSDYVMGLSLIHI